MDNFLIFFSLFMLSISAIGFLFVKDSLSMVLLTGFVSLFSALSYITLDAVDVAFTEIAVGGGISTALFVAILYLTKSYEINIIDNSRYVLTKGKRFINYTIILSFMFIFLELLPDIPLFGLLNNPAHNNIYVVYITESLKTFSVPNSVTMVLGSFRGYDTLGETTVVLIAGLGVYLILNTFSHMHREQNIPSSLTELPNNNKFDYVLSSALFAILPVMLLYGFYVQFHGDFGPGGGFQAGVLIACTYGLLSVFFGSYVANKFISTNLLLILLSTGVCIYTLVGFYTIFAGGSFLDYYWITNDTHHSYHYGLFSIELGVGISVFASLAIIIDQFYKKIGDTNND